MGGGGGGIAPPSPITTLSVGVELCLSLVGAWGGAEVSLEMNFGPCED